METTTFEQLDNRVGELASAKLSESLQLRCYSAGGKFSAYVNYRGFSGHEEGPTIAAAISAATDAAMRRYAGAVAQRSLNTGRNLYPYKIN